MNIIEKLDDNTIIYHCTNLILQLYRWISYLFIHKSL